VQYALIRKLADLDKNICVVGDDAQSIYAFRGADIRNILDFRKKDYPDCAIFRLEQNYRSTKTILGAADSLMKNNVDQMPKKLWTANEAENRLSCRHAKTTGRRGNRSSPASRRNRFTRRSI